VDIAGFLKGVEKKRAGAVWTGERCWGCRGRHLRSARWLYAYLRGVEYGVDCI
jgi:hypothetical protein